jgi:hypothetical protein
LAVSDSFLAYSKYEGSNLIFHVRNSSKEIVQHDDRDVVSGFFTRFQPRSSDSFFAFQEKTSGKLHILTVEGQEVVRPTGLIVKSLNLSHAGFVVKDDMDESHFFDGSGNKTYHLKKDDVLDMDRGRSSLIVGQGTFAYVESAAPYRFRAFDFSGKEIFSAKDRIIITHHTY